MDVIAAHQQGLLEQLQEEASALAGRAREHGQRAVVLHHLYDHSRGGHVWALAEAGRALRIARGITVLQRRLDRWGWVIARREEAATALDRLVNALGEASRARTLAAYRAYRLSATPALRSEAERILPPDLLVAFDHCHAARRAREDLPVEIRDQLAVGSEAIALAAMDSKRLIAAWAAIEATGLGRAAHRLLGDRALARGAARDRRRGWPRVERELRDNPSLPASFQANPAQHFYALHRDLAERRRQQWREACDREPDAFELAA
ncbi:MAG TPA: hypothetical protein VFO12_05200 [Sphingomicrobium sp.]|nr:hypothetical protein [Sphingomicrobium sp.]